MNDRELVETANMLIGQIQKRLPGQTALMLVVQWTTSGQTTVSAAGDFDALANEAPIKVVDWARKHQAGRLSTTRHDDDITEKVKVDKPEKRTSRAPTMKMRGLGSEQPFGPSRRFGGAK